jgi:hypothetical protein
VSDQVRRRSATGSSASRRAAIDCGRFAANLDEMAQRVLTESFAALLRAAADRASYGLDIACFLEHDGAPVGLSL